MADREQFPADRPRPAVQLPRIHQAAHEILFHQQIRIQRQNPFRPVRPYPLILRLGKPDIVPVPNHLYAVAEFLEDCRVPSAEALSTTTTVARMPFWAITAFKQRRMYRLLLKVTMEMHTVGSGMGFWAVQVQRPFRCQSNYTKSNHTEIFFVEKCS